MLQTAIYILAKSATCELKASAPFQLLVLLMTARKVKGLNIPTGLVNAYLTYSTFTKYVNNPSYDYLYHNEYLSDSSKLRAH